jgi:hypothetical protein
LKPKTEVGGWKQECNVAFIVCVLSEVVLFTCDCVCEREREREREYIIFFCTLFASVCVGRVVMDFKQFGPMQQQRRGGKKDLKTFPN